MTSDKLHNLSFNLWDSNCWLNWYTGRTVNDVVFQHFLSRKRVLNFYISRPEFDISRSITSQPGDFKICYCSSAVVEKPHQWQSSLYPVKNDFNILCHIFLLIRIKENSRLQNSIKPRHSEIWKMLKGLFNLHMYRDFCSSQSNNPHMWIFIFSSWILRCLEGTYLLM